MGKEVQRGRDRPEDIYFDVRPANPDGSYTDMPADDDVVSITYFCDRCGLGLERKEQVRLRKGNYMYCRDCAKDFKDAR